MNKKVLATFPYPKTSDGRSFPIVSLKLRYRKELTKTSALIDSGATVSIFRPEVAEDLGIAIEKGEEIIKSAGQAFYEDFDPEELVKALREFNYGVHELGPGKKYVNYFKWEEK